MPRDVFPFHEDRVAIHHFLLGGDYGGSHHLKARAADGLPGVRLLELHTPLEAMIAAIGNDGALYGYLNAGSQKLHYTVKVQNYMLQVLGDARRINMRPVVRTGAQFAGQQHVASAPHLDDIELPVNVPWLIAGRLTLMAHRATVEINDNHTTGVDDEETE